jgi:hypothetical protein
MINDAATAFIAADPGDLPTLARTGRDLMHALLRADAVAASTVNSFAVALADALADAVADGDLRALRFMRTQTARFLPILY